MTNNDFRRDFFPEAEEDGFRCIHCQMTFRMPTPHECQVLVAAEKEMQELQRIHALQIPAPTHMREAEPIHSQTDSEYLAELKSIRRYIFRLKVRILRLRLLGF